MALTTIGTKMYIIDPAGSNGPVILPIECAVSIDGLGAPREQNDITCLEDNARQFIGGLATPGTMTVTVNFDPQNESHIRMHEMYVNNTRFDAAIGLGDGDSAPTLDSSDEFDLPADRSWIELLQAYVSDYPFTINLNAVVQSAIAFQLSGFPTVFPKSQS